MKKQLRTNPVLKAVAVILLLVLAAGGFWASRFTLYKWDDIWTGAGYYDSNNYYANLYNRLGQVQELARLTQEKAWDGGLSYLDQQRLENLKEMLAAPDGVHLSAGNGYGAWVTYLRNHAKYSADNSWTMGSVYSAQ